MRPPDRHAPLVREPFTERREIRFARAERLDDPRIAEGVVREVDVHESEEYRDRVRSHDGFRHLILWKCDHAEPEGEDGGVLHVEHRLRGWDPLQTWGRKRVASVRVVGF